MIENNEIIEKVILVAVSIHDGDDTEASLTELADLVKTAGAMPVAKIIQNRESFDNATYVGKGKIDEIRIMAEEIGATGIVCDDELSPAQLNNLESALQIKVMDRTLIVLDIFAQRATTSEGKIQVELAQLKYRAARLVGLRNSLSRLGGGIGTKGPGEKKLEMDKRLIRDRISQLNKELNEVKSHREVQRKQRSENMMPLIAIVGYTNAGKSTLLNKLTNAGVLEEDKLFATLDPVTRNLRLESGQEILLTDTVGFIRKLPHHLVEAFRSTLEEAKYADIILHVVDASNEEMDKQMHLVYETLRSLEVKDKIIVTAFNKQDALEGREAILKDLKAEKTFNISARSGAGLDELLAGIEEILRGFKVYIEKTLDYNEASKVQLIRKYGQLISEEYTEDGILVKGYVPHSVYGKI